MLGGHMFVIYKFVNVYYCSNPSASLRIWWQNLYLLSLKRHSTCYTSSKCLEIWH